jgi:cobalt/nickel transport system permease protein
MHIPDGFLATPVWAALDVAAVPAVAAMTRKAQQGFDEKRVPLLGVMGAFVFAAQMINFPVGAGTSGHLVGGALLAVTLGPAAASVVLTAILAIQALVFQDGGVLALGANVTNMAIFGVLAGYLPYHLWRNKASVFAGGFLSVLVSAILAIGELRLSGIAMPGTVLAVSFGLFIVSALLEGAITVAVVQSLEAMHPGKMERPAPEGNRTVAFLGLAALVLAVVGVMFASASPDGLERLAENLGIAARAKALVSTPLADYQAGFLQSLWLRKAAAGLTGLALIYAACAAFGRWIAPRQRSA